MQSRCNDLGHKERFRFFCGYLKALIQNVIHALGRKSCLFCILHTATLVKS